MQCAWDPCQYPPLAHPSRWKSALRGSGHPPVSKPFAMVFGKRKTVFIILAPLTCPLFLRYSRAERMPSQSKRGKTEPFSPPFPPFATRKKKAGNLPPGLFIAGRVASCFLLKMAYSCCETLERGNTSPWLQQHWLPFFLRKQRRG